MNFEDLQVIPPLLKALMKEGFTRPTEIQKKAIPIALQWKDILGCAQTGSGKTLAFALPILQMLYNNRLKKWLVEWKIKRKIQVLILAPTRELAIQIGEDLWIYCTNTNFKHTVIYGWVNQFHQVKAIEKWVEVLIATPGRLEDLISQWFIKLSYVEFFVLDEADRMLEMGSWQDLKKIFKRLPEEKQTLFFSATMPKTIIELSNSILKEPEHICVHPVASSTDFIRQTAYFLNRNYKRQLLQQIVKRKDLESVIVFVNTINESERVFEFLQLAGIRVNYINKNKTQNQRQWALNELKQWDIKVLVATDIASRWLDVSNLSCVVNYDIPNDAETYVHRIGRTGRAWEKWLSITFCTPLEKEKLIAIEKLTGKTIENVADESYKEERVPQWRWEKTQKLADKNKEKIKKRKQYGKNTKSSSDRSVGWKKIEFKKTGSKTMREHKIAPKRQTKKR